MQEGVRDLDLSQLNPNLNARLITTEAGLADVHDFLARTDEFGWDYETNIVPGFVERKVRTMQVGDRHQQYVIDFLAFAGSPEALLNQGHRKQPSWMAPILNATQSALESGSKVKAGVNLSFEYETANWCMGMRPWNFWDCQEVERHFYCGKVPFFQKDFWGMEPMVARYLGFRIDKTLQKSFDLSTPLTEDQVTYAALDTRLPLAIKIGQMRTAAKLGVERVVAMENHAIPAFSQMRLNGKLLSEDRWRGLIQEINEQHVKDVKLLDTYFLPVVGPAIPPVFDLAGLEAKWQNEKDKETRKQYLADLRAARREIKAFEKAKEKFEGDAAINYAGTDQLLNAMRKMGFTEKKLPNTSKKAMARHSDKPVVQAVQSYRKTQKALTTYGLDWLDYADPETGRIHAHFIQTGTETGRASCTKPNLFNLPKDKRYRRSFVARPGYKIITIDMSGAELRILAELAGEPVWIDAFAQRWDVHSISAQMMDGARWDAGKGVNCAFDHDKQKCTCPAHAQQRDESKALNFGVAYGKEAYALAEDLKISSDAAESILKLWRASFKRVQQWLVDAGNFAKMNLYAKSFSGRTRFFEKPTWDKAKELAIKDAEKYKRLPQANDITKKYSAMFRSIEREGKNSPIQAGNADVAKTGMGSGCDKNGVPFMWHLLPNYNFTTEDGVLKEAGLINFVYDEYVVECPEETAEACRAMLGDCIQRAGAEFMTSVTMEWEARIEDEWTK